MTTVTIFTVKADHVDSQGGAIVSTANKENNDLTANSLTFSNIKNKSSYDAKTVALSGDEFIHIKNVLNRYIFKDKESIARILSETLDRLYFFEVDEECSNCNRSGLLTWKAIDDDPIVFECRQCGFIGTLEDNPIKNVVPVSNIDLKKVNFI